MQGPALRITWVAAEELRKGGHKIDGFNGPIDHGVFTNAGTHGQQPRGSGERVASAVVLEAVAAGICVAVAAEIGEDEKVGASFVFRVVLDGAPEHAADAVGAHDGIGVEREGSGVRDVDVVQRDPEQSGRELFHHMRGDVKGELVGAGGRTRVREEVANGELHQLRHRLHGEDVVFSKRCRHRRFVVVAQETLVVGRDAGMRSEQLLGKNDGGSAAAAVEGMIALADVVEAIAGRDDPAVGGGAAQIMPEVLKQSGMLWRDGSEVIEGLVTSRGETCVGDIVAENAAVDDLRVEGGLWNQLCQKVWNVALTLCGEGFFIARSAAEGNDDSLWSTWSDDRVERGETEQTGGRPRTADGIKKLAPRPRALTRLLQQTILRGVSRNRISRER